MGACRDIEAFRDLLNHRGLWLNSRAAMDVYDYLKALAEGVVIRDEELAEVRGGTTARAFDYERLVPLLWEISDRL